MSDAQDISQRNQIVDLMKGLAILLMLVGHTGISTDGFLYKFIYSFHMPLFFIIAGYYAKSIEETKRSYSQTLWKDVKRLLVPYLLTAIAIILFKAIQTIIKHDISFVYERAIGLLYVTYDAGPIWFLVALFLMRIFFRPLMRLSRWALPISIVLSGLAIVIAHHLFQLPFCLLTAISLMVFYAIGWYYRRYGFPIWAIVLCLLCWPFVIYGPRIDLYYMRWGIYPLTVLGACGGTYAIFALCCGLYKVVNKQHKYIGQNLLQRTCNFIRWAGINSLIILCFHTFDMYCCWITMLLKGLFNRRMVFSSFYESSAAS